MKFTNNAKIPKMLYDKIVSNNYDQDPNDLSKISVTQLISPPRIRLLFAKNYNNIEIEAVKNLWATLGSIVHEIIINDGDNYITEKRLTFDAYPHLTLTGKFDVYEKESQTLSDFKYTSAYSLIYNPDGKDEWIQQLNCYRFLCKINGIPVKSLKIHAILRDWTPYQAKKDNNYPQQQVVTLNIPVWSFEFAKNFILSRLELHYNEQKKENYQLCNDTERWTKGQKWAVYKNNDTKKAFKLFDNFDEAKLFIDNFNKQYPSVNLTIVHRPGESTRCIEYCSVNKFCDFYINNIQNKQEE
jgi:hypothetical protein